MSILKNLGKHNTRDWVARLSSRNLTGRLGWSFNARIESLPALPPC
ncbi:MAG: hypothetical protein ACI96P_002375, partial [Candidatus Azotimanducaceae bacterium]